MNELSNSLMFFGTPLIAVNDLLLMLFRFAFNTFIVWLLVHTLYYAKSHRRDYYFTFMLIGISIFFLIYLLSGVKLKIGLALGLFAIFGIIRYRTDPMPVREMTYLFMIISLSVINALAMSTSYVELIATNAFFFLAAWFFESHKLLHPYSTKIIQYDRIELIVPERRAELIADLEKRTGLKVQRVEVGGMDFLRDMAIIKISYEYSDIEANSVDNVTKLSRSGWNDIQN